MQLWQKKAITIPRINTSRNVSIQIVSVAVRIAKLAITEKRMIAPSTRKHTAMRSGKNRLSRVSKSLVSQEVLPLL